jgi:hypothetical protein
MDRAVKLTFGGVKYCKRGAVFTPYHDDYPRWVHVKCTPRLHLSSDMCQLEGCGTQFYPTETAVDLIVGHIEANGRFVEQGALGCAHWACLCWNGIPLDEEG